MQRWDYKVVVRAYTVNGGGQINFTWPHDPKDKRNGEEVLQALGQEGWELVSMTTIPTPYPTGAVHYTLKRPLQA